MHRISPGDLVLRCYAQKTEKANLVGTCLEFDISVEASNFEELKKKMNQAIESYIQVVLDTNDRDSVPVLLSRRAPLKDWILYYFFKHLHRIRKFPGNFTFKELIPFHLAHSC